MRKSKPLIAVVDDEASVRVALQRLIRSAGLDVKTFPSGTEILDFLRTPPVVDVDAPLFPDLLVERLRVYRAALERANPFVSQPEAASA